MQLQLTLSTSTKQCGRCREVKPLTEFYKNQRAKDGLTWHCKDCAKSDNSAYRQTEAWKLVRKTARDRYSARKRGDLPPFMPKAVYELPQIAGTPRNRINNRAQRMVKSAFVQQVKVHIGCQVCSEREAVCLDFHHRDPSTKLFLVSGQHTGYRLGRIIEEMLKCSVLCSNCHRKVHAGILSTDDIASVTLADIDAALV